MSVLLVLLALCQPQNERVHESFPWTATALLRALEHGCTRQDVFLVLLDSTMTQFQRMWVVCPVLFRNSPQEMSTSILIMLQHQQAPALTATQNSPTN